MNGKRIQVDWTSLREWDRTSPDAPRRRGKCPWGNLRGQASSLIDPARPRRENLEKEITWDNPCSKTVQSGPSSWKAVRRRGNFSGSPLQKRATSPAPREALPASEGWNAGLANSSENDESEKDVENLLKSEPPKDLQGEGGGDRR